MKVLYIKQSDIAGESAIAFCYEALFKYFQ